MTGWGLGTAISGRQSASLLWSSEQVPGNDKLVTPHRGPRGLRWQSLPGDWSRQFARFRWRGGEEVGGHPKPHRPAGKRDVSPRRLPRRARPSRGCGSGGDCWKCTGARHLLLAGVGDRFIPSHSAEAGMWRSRGFPGGDRESVVLVPWRLWTMPGGVETGQRAGSGFGQGPILPGGGSRG